MKTIYQVLNTGTDGRDEYTVGFFELPHAAERCVEEQGPGYGRMVEHKLFYDTEDFYNNEGKDALRKKALAKLSKEEKKALGLR